MERDQLQAAEKKLRDAIASPDSDGWKEPVAKEEEDKKPNLGGPTLPKLECKVLEKIIGKTKENLDLRLARASIDIDKPPKAVFDLVWDINGYKQWDSATVSEQKIVQEIEPNKTQIIHVKHKVLAASCIRRDLCLIRTWREEAGGYIVIITSTTSPKVPKSSDFCRAEVPFAGFLIQNVNGKTRLTAVSVVDFGAWLHEKFIEAESIRVGQRITKIKQRLA